MRHRLVLLAFLGCLGCSTARLRIGPLGSGIALPTTGPGIELAVSDASGTPLLAARLAVNLPATLATLWLAVQRSLPQLALLVGSGAATPTGPSPADEW